MTHTHCDFCKKEIPDEDPSKVYVVEIRGTASNVQLRRDACGECAGNARRILTLADGEQLKEIVDSVTFR